MRISPDHKTSREGIVLQDNLVDNTRTRFPETNTILCVEGNLCHHTVEKKGLDDVTRFCGGGC